MKSDYTIDELCLKITDGSHSSPKAFANGKYMLSVKDMLDYGFSYASCKTISENDYNKLVQQGCKPEINDILIAKDGSVLKHIFRVKQNIDAVLLSSIAILRPNIKLIDPQYLVYILKNPIMHKYIMNNFKSGTGVPRIVLKDFKKIQLSIPNLETQKKIAHILSTLDDKIELNRKINQTLEEMAQALFKSWFVDFDPVKAKASCSSDEELEAVAKELGISKEVLELFPSEFEDSELGMIPKGWSVSTLENEFNIVMGQSPAGTSYNENNDGTIFFQGRRDFGRYYPNERVYTTEPKRLAKEDDILLSVRAPVGDINIAIQECCIGRGLASLKHKNNAVGYSYFVIKNLRKFFDSYNTEGTVFGSVNQKTLKSMNTIFDDKIIDKYNLLIEPIFLQIKNNEQEIQTFQKTRDTLLPKLLSGEVDVSKITTKGV